MAFYQLKAEQQIPASVDEVWQFISAPENLKKITPSYMGFDITSGGDMSKMYPGMIISYKVSPVLGIKMTWVTEITHVEDKVFFVDEQRVGPYKLWHHQHLLEENNEGVLMKDIVTYVPPMGVLGAMANALFIKGQLNQIFAFRKQAVEKMFPEK